MCANYNLDPVYCQKSDFSCKLPFLVKKWKNYVFQTSKNSVYWQKSDLLSKFTNFAYILVEKRENQVFKIGKIVFIGRNQFFHVNYFFFYILVEKEKNGVFQIGENGHMCANTNLDPVYCQKSDFSCKLPFTPYILVKKWKNYAFQTSKNSVYWQKSDLLCKLYYFFPHFG